MKYWIWRETGELFGVAYAPMGDAGGGASTQPADAGSPDVGDAPQGDPNAGEPADGEDAPDDDERLLLGDPDEDEDPRRRRTPEEENKILRKNYRKLQRKYFKGKPVLDRTRDVNLDDVFQKAARYDQLSSTARENPKFRALLYGGDPEAAESARPAPPRLPDLPNEFTVQSLGFDPDDSPANRVIANAIQTIAALKADVADLRRMSGRVESVERTVTNQTVAQESREWNGAWTALETELRKALPNMPGVITSVRDNFRAAYLDRKSHGLTGQQIAKHYLKELKLDGKVTPRQAGQVSAGVQSRMAQHNSTLPRPPGGGAPASPQGAQKRFVKDVNRDFKAGRIGPRF